MKICKSAVVVFTMAMLSGSSMIAQAWWGDLIYPGAEVFDAKRFADHEGDHDADDNRGNKQQQ